MDDLQAFKEKRPTGRPKGSGGGTRRQVESPVVSVGLSVRQRDVCDAILRGIPVPDAMFQAGYSNNLCQQPNLFLRSAKVQRYLSWHEKRQAVRAVDIESHANLRLIRMLEDDETPPMVHALLIRTAHDYARTLREFTTGGEDGPDQYVEAVVRIRRKLAANTAPDLKTFETIAHAVEEKLTEQAKALPQSQRQYPESKAP